jgi:thioredoxin 1
MSDTPQKISGKKLIYFSAPWCVPCKRIKPVIEEAGAFVEVVKIDVEQHPQLAADYNIKGIPTVIFMVDEKVTMMINGASDALIGAITSFYEPVNS